ncbi:MAG: hypothetical protein AB8I08_22710 [Sandaracinaceae bacterium]
MRCLTLLTGLLCASPVAAQSTDGFVHIVRTQPTATRHSHPVTLGRFSGQHVRLGERVRPASSVLYATDNDNDHFMLYLRHRSRPCQTLALRMGSDVLAGGGSGSGSGETPCSASFELDRATANRVAAALAIPLHRRHPIGERVSATFEGPSHVRAGEPVEVRVRMQNPTDAPTVLRMVGGRQRGPRNDRFHFRVVRDGVPVAEIDALNFGGMTGPTPLTPGGEAVLSETVGRWADVSVPGRYEVTCTYETEFLDEGGDLQTALTTARLWTRIFTGIVRFTVRSP